MIKKDLKIQILFPTIDRWDRIDLMLRNFEIAEFPSDTKILALVTSDNKYYNYLKKGLYKIFGKEKTELVRMKDLVPKDHDLLRKNDSKWAGFTKANAIKRDNVAKTYTKAAEMADKDVDYYWIIEDDTLFPPDTFYRYLQFMKALKADVVSGLSYSYGINFYNWRNLWKIKFKKTFGENDSADEKTVDIKRIKPKNEVIRLGATGLGNVLLKKKVIKGWRPTLPSDKGLGSDIDFFCYCKQRGYKAYAIKSINLPHFHKLKNGDIRLLGTIDKQLWQQIIKPLKYNYGKEKTKKN